jgi:hypothetical protein
MPSRQWLYKTWGNRELTWHQNNVLLKCHTLSYFTIRGNWPTFDGFHKIFWVSKIYVQTLPKSHKVSSRNSFAWKWSPPTLLISYSDGCCGLGLSRLEKINSCDPVTRIRHSCGFLITSYGNSRQHNWWNLYLVHTPNWKNSNSQI